MLELAKLVSVVAVVVGVHGVQPPLWVEDGGDHDQDSEEDGGDHEDSEACVVVVPPITITSSSLEWNSSLQKKNQTSTDIFYLHHFNSKVIICNGYRQITEVVDCAACIFITQTL